MKIGLNFVILIIAVLTACDAPSETKVLEESEVEKSDTMAAPPAGEKQVPEPKYDYYWVRFKSGINYSESPNGKVLGQLPLNTRLKVIPNGGIGDTIVKGSENDRGQWVAIELNSDTVYAFDSLISPSYTFSDVKIYYGPYSSKEGVGFVNTSEGFIKYNGADSLPIVSKEDIGEDVFWLKDKNKHALLRNTGISNEDTLFLYNLDEDSICKFAVAEIRGFARLNGYAQKDDPYLSDYDYEVGFDVGMGYELEGETFAFIGSQSPFQTGRVQPILWEVVDSLLLVEVLSQSFVPSTIREKFRNTENLKVFSFSYAHFEYYMLANMRSSTPYAYHLIVIDNNESKVVFNHIFEGSESKHTLPLGTAENKELDIHQWTGAIFKDKPPIIYGFLGYSFGCPIIRFAGNDPPILILCDNRH